ncbi:PAS domain S-box-containing protein/diguanylate cyclase (GGDEF) domain-containing protein [Hathewaya proteolytica DSM 3090]|uniref:PAS domain S-box-containing protein/diguanylate cyclase (GGDEF) domain-containing protein n=1 Tax=Hathewaya proteolytica DSM 3090 TaxID=1121331 RepID=A0A1M6PRS9_9CLOT|nr:HD domain-containing phosphohydrolase [Hathewaya proteolytica]SHK10591.1 PAS domain S-box-containing protein/diguanylate cyclase (GGDEF) domain-containing protein [Hathewaya proteolytica DSM 3090]
MDEKYFKAFIQSISCPVWTVGLDKKYIYVNDQYCKLFHMDDKDIDNDIIGKSIMEVAPKHLCNLFSYRLDEVLKDGTEKEYETEVNGKYIKCYIFPTKDEQGHLIAFSGLIVDISDRREKEIELSKQKSILQTIMDTIPDPIFYKDIHGKYITINKRCRSDLEEMCKGEIIGKNDMEIMYDKNLAKKFMEDDNKIISSGIVVNNQPKMVLPTGEVKIKESVKAPIMDDDNNVIGIVGLARDVTEKYEMERKLKYLCYTDVLTGLYNRASFESKIKELQKEENLPLGVIMGDVNGLKLINDTFGHLEGDRLLISISKVLKDSCPEVANLFRWGGDEFVIILPCFDDNKCRGVMEVIKKSCEKFKGSPIELSISLGGAIQWELSDNIYDVLKEAEEILYRHKILEKNNLLNSTMTSLLKNLERKSLETEHHTERMVRGAAYIGKKLNFSVGKMEDLIMAVKLHDIGKIAIDEDILTNSNNLTKDEIETMRTHCEKGYRIAKACNCLESVARAVLYHHERYDGQGYPLGIMGKDIPVISRIISVVDSYDAMTNGNFYKEPIPENEAVKEILRCSGSQFDPEIVNYFLEYIRELS